MKKILVTGVNGQLGFDVVKHIQAIDRDEVLGVDIGDFDLSDAAAVKAFIHEFRPDAVVHCAAYTAVDKAETDSELCHRVNVEGSRNIATGCQEVGAKLVYISTDYVYGGTGDRAYETDEPTAPLGVYGKTKLAGEDACKQLVDKLYIVRTSWVFGKNGNNFVRTMLRLATERESLNVVNDQIGTPTYTVDLAAFIVYLLDTDKYGVYHFTNEGFCSWYEFAKEIFAQAGKRIALNGIPTIKYKTAAVRPLNSRLSKNNVYAIGYPAIPSWQDALKRYLEEIKE